MDGNRRWAAANGLPLIEGYRRGVAALREAVRGAIDAGVGMLTVYGFSTENWNREQREVDLLMQLCALFARSERRSLGRQGVRVRTIGDVEAFPATARAALRHLVEGTGGNTRLTLTLALNYSGRAEIVRAAQAVARDAATGRLQPDEIDEAALRARMYAPDTSDPDLLIRTGGEYRVSNFLLYHIAYTELITLPIMWPEFTAEHFLQALGNLAVRERRYGA
jgi:undecaprenyl diphosphate synthase